MNQLGNRRRIAGGAMVLGAGMSLASLAHAQSSWPDAYFPQGYVALEVGPGGGPQVAWYDMAGRLVPDPDPSDSTPNPIPLAVDRRCRVTNLDAVARLLELRMLDGADLHYVEGGLGSRRNGNCSQGNGRIVQGETMVVSPGSYLSNMVMGGARPNIEGKFGARLAYTTDGSAAVEVDLPGTSSDNGADAADRDNTLVTIASPDGGTFRTLALSPVADGRGEIALDSGADSLDPAPSSSLFYVGFEYAVDCGESVTEDGVGTIGGLTFVRNDNKEGPCSPIGLAIDFEVGGATEGGAPRDVASVDHSTTGSEGEEQLVRARVRIEWTVDRFDGAGALRTQEDLDLELAREVQYPGGEPEPVTYCSSIEPALVDGVPADLLDPWNPGSVVHPEDQPWCLLAEERQLDGDVIRQILILDVGGDPKFF